MGCFTNIFSNVYSQKGAVCLFVYLCLAWIKHRCKKKKALGLQTTFKEATKQNKNRKTNNNNNKTTHQLQRRLSKIASQV